MNFYTPERGKEESFDQYKKRQKEQKKYMKRGCYIYSHRLYRRGNKLVRKPYVKEI